MNKKKFSILKSTLVILISLVSLNSFALTLDQEKEITGITCGVGGPGSWSTLSFSNGAYIDMVGNYAWIQFQDENQLTVKIFKRRPLISSVGGLVKDDLIMKHTHTLDNLETYSNFDKLFEVEFDIAYDESSFNFMNPLKIFDKKRIYSPIHNKLSCQIVKSHITFERKLYLDNTVRARFPRNERSQNQYKGTSDHKTRQRLKSLEKKYEESILKKK